MSGDGWVWVWVGVRYVCLACGWVCYGAFMDELYSHPLKDLDQRHGADNALGFEPPSPQLSFPPRCFIHALVWCRTCVTGWCIIITRGFAKSER